jgi:hypothetical protein
MAFNRNKLLEFCKEECEKHGVKLVLHKGKYIKLADSMNCSGWFDESNEPSLHIAKGRKDWADVLAHEISHVYQWVEQTKAWVKYHESKLNIDEWLAGREYTKAQINKGINAAIRMERECEQKSLRLLEKYGFEDGARYMQMANAYTLFYFWVRDNRLWSKAGKSPYSQPIIWQAFPAKWKINIKETYNTLKDLYQHTQ